MDNTQCGVEDEEDGDDDGDGGDSLEDTTGGADVGASCVGDVPGDRLELPVLPTTTAPALVIFLLQLVKPARPKLPVLVVLLLPLLPLPLPPEEER